MILDNPFQDHIQAYRLSILKGKSQCTHARDSWRPKKAQNLRKRVGNTSQDNDT